LIPALALICGSCRNAPGGGPEGFAAPPGTDYSFLPRRAEKGQVFRFYQAREKSAWKRNWAGALDFSGVSWNDRRTATLISPIHVVMAGHFIRPSDVPVMFHDRSGQPHERFISKVRSLPHVGDIAVAKLNRPLPPGVRIYRFATAGEAFPGRPVVVTDQTMTASVHQIAAVHGDVIRLDYVPGLDPVCRRNLIKGDSGNPSFIVRADGELALLETHTAGGAGAGPFYGSPRVQEAIRAALAELGN
jgi:hypothetical protein